VLEAAAGEGTPCQEGARTNEASPNASAFHGVTRQRSETGS
jgi:hypothetical protein